MIENGIRKAAKVCEQLYQAYRVNKGSIKDDEIVINWGNGVLYDRNATWAEYLELVRSRLLKPEIALAYYYNIKWNTAEDLAKIREMYMPDLQALLGGE